MKGYIGTGGLDLYDSKKDFWEYDPLTNAWTRKADFAGKTRYSAVGFSMGKKGYIGTGYDDINFRYANDFWEYNPATNTWKQKAVYGGPGLGQAVGFSIGTKGYVGTGDDGNGFIRKDFWEYNLATNSWTQKKDFGESVRDFAVSFSIGNKGYIGTGSDGGRLPPFSKKDFWEYDPGTNVWAQKADFGGTERQAAVGFSIGSKGYVGTGYDADHYNFLKDFWEYDPVTNAWTQKADFGGIERQAAVGFSIGSKGYIGLGKDVFLNFYKDLWEYDPATDTWTPKADFGGDGRTNAVAFNIGSKGYVGTGSVYSNYYKDFWEYDPSADTWVQKADFGGNAREAAGGFSVGNKGYIGTGDDGDFSFYKDFWEYNSSADTWVQKADFGGDARHAATGFSIGNRGYIGTGEVYFEDLKKDFWEYIPDENLCKPPTDLRVTNVTDTAARLKWTTPVSPVHGFQVVYRPANSAEWITKWRPSETDHIILKGLLPNTTYKWAIRSLCKKDDHSKWVVGPDFTTAAPFALSSVESSPALINKPGQTSVRIMPNPNNGNFTIEMQLPKALASTTLILYNTVGGKIWQQDAGKVSGTVYKNISLANKLTQGVYLFVIQRDDTRMIQKIVISK